MKDIRIGTIVQGRKAPELISQVIGHGFESFELTFGPRTTDVDLTALAEKVMPLLRPTDAVISALGVYANPLLEDEAGEEARKSWMQAIKAAADFGCDIVAGFTGALPGKSITDALDRYVKVFDPIARLAEDYGISIAFENCDMGGTLRAATTNLALTPDAWEMLFNALPNDNIGLEWEPCHQMTKLIDPMPQLRKYGDRMFHIHGKDATVRWDIVREKGIIGLDTFAYHRTPGFGDSNWADIISFLRLGGFTGAIDIEGYHDPVYCGELEWTGQVRGLKYLKECRGGDFIQNPVI